MIFPLLSILVVLPHYAFAYTISHDCLDPAFVGLGINIPAAVAEALSIAEYGRWRLQTNQPAVGTVLQQLLGNNGNARSMFINRMGALPAAFGQFTGIFNPLAPLDHTLVIKCAPNTFMRITDNHGVNTLGWWDSEFPHMPTLMGADEPCNANVAATTYLTGYSRTQNLAGSAILGPSHDIVLCGTALGQAMFRRNTIGTDWSQRRWEGQSFDILDQYLPPTLLHEVMHVAGLPGRLPSGSDEMYEWSNIVTSNRNDDKQANADSYAILASVLWMKRHTVGSQGLWGRRHRVNNRPGNSPNDGHP